MDKDFEFDIKTFNCNVIAVNYKSKLNFKYTDEKVIFGSEFINVVHLNQKDNTLEPIDILVIDAGNKEFLFTLPKKVPVNVGDIVNIEYISMYDHKHNFYKDFTYYKFINYSENICKSFYTNEELANFFAGQIGSSYFNRIYYPKILSALIEKKNIHVGLSDLRRIALSDAIKTHRAGLYCPNCHARLQRYSCNKCHAVALNPRNIKLNTPHIYFVNIKCPNCHYKNKPNANFCSECGSKLNNVELDKSLFY